MRRIKMRWYTKKKVEFTLTVDICSFQFNLLFLGSHFTSKESRIKLKGTNRQMGSHNSTTNSWQGLLFTNVWTKVKLKSKNLKNHIKNNIKICRMTHNIWHFSNPIVYVQASNWVTNNATQTQLNIATLHCPTKREINCAKNQLRKGKKRVGMGGEYNFYKNMKFYSYFNLVFLKTGESGGYYFEDYINWLKLETRSKIGLVGKNSPRFFWIYKVTHPVDPSHSHRIISSIAFWWEKNEYLHIVWNK